MKVLLDTHALLWWVDNDRRLGPRACAIIANPGNDIIVSVVSLWEIAIKVRIGKLRANLTKISGLIPRNSFALLAIDLAHLRALAALPDHHRDPFDLLLIAQASAEAAAFMSNDRNVPKYPIQSMPCDQ